VKSNVISLNKYRCKRNKQDILDMARAADELIEEAYKRGVCEYCGSFLDYPYHKEPCQLAKNGDTYGQ
jgi:hypothetical protein